jgi:hypothetical protein
MKQIQRKKREAEGDDPSGQTPIMANVKFIYAYCHRCSHGYRICQPCARRFDGDEGRRLNRAAEFTNCTLGELLSSNLCLLLFLALALALALLVLLKHRFTAQTYRNGRITTHTLTLCHTQPPRPTPVPLTVRLQPCDDDGQQDATAMILFVQGDGSGNEARCTPRLIWLRHVPSHVRACMGHGRGR